MSYLTEEEYEEFRRLFELVCDAKDEYTDFIRTNPTPSRYSWDDRVQLKDSDSIDWVELNTISFSGRDYDGDHVAGEVPKGWFVDPDHVKERLEREWALELKQAAEAAESLKNLNKQKKIDSFLKARDELINDGVDPNELI